jgi:hypothetical protein
MATRQKCDSSRARETAQKQRTNKPIQQGPVVLTEQAELAMLQRAIADPGRAAPADILALQRAAGNQAVTRLIQAKLMVGPAGDRYEQEADRVAEQVMGMQLPSPDRRGAGGEVQRQAPEEEEIQTKPLAASITPLMQRQEVPEEEEIQTKPLLQRQAEEEEEQVQTKPLMQRQAEEEEEIQMMPLLQRQADGSFEAGSKLESRLTAHKGGGNPLPEDVRAYMEPRFGTDFSRVRVHTGDEAVQTTRELNAQAFTHGQDIYLGAGRYNPGTTAGKRLLAHELTHVVQQNGVAGRRLQHKPMMGVIQRAVGFEFEADNYESRKLERPPTVAENTSGEIEQRNCNPAKLPKGEPLYRDAANNFELQADEVGDSSDLEFVTGQFAEADAGGLTTVLNEIVRIAGDIHTQWRTLMTTKPVAYYVWTQRQLGLTSPSGDNYLIRSNHLAPLKFKMQATSGIRLDQIAKMMEAIGTSPNAAAEGPLAARRAEGRQNLQSQHIAGGHVGAAPGQVAQSIAAFMHKYATSTKPLIIAGLTSMQPAGDGTDALKGLLSLIYTYIHMAGTLQILSYPKAIAPIMARTNFAQMFTAMLPANQRTMLEQDEGKLFQELVKLCLSDNPTLQSLDKPMFLVQEWDGQKMFRDLTRREWLKGIARGQDILSKAGYKQWQEDKYNTWLTAARASKWKPRWYVNRKEGSKRATKDARKGHAEEWMESLGSKGTTTEAVGPGIQSPIFELRGIWNSLGTGTYTPAEAKTIALKIRKYMDDINNARDKYFGEL